MRKNIEFSAGALLLGCVVAACSGGGGTSLPAAPQGSTPLRHQSVAFSIKIPAAVTTAARSPKYVSASTQSVSIVETDGTAAPNPAVVANTTPGSPNCTAASGTTTCTISVNANVGTDTFLVKTYDQQNAGGNLLSSGTVQGVVVAGQANSFPVTLAGAVSSIALIAADAYPQVNGSTTVSAQAKDADGNTIIGTYDAPVSLTTSGSATLSQAQLGSSADQSTVTLAASQTAAFTVTASAGTKTANVTLNPSSGIVYYNVGSGSNDVTGFHIMAGTDGKLYYTTVGALQCNQNNFCFGSSGAVGQLDPSTGSFNEIPLPTYEPVTTYQTADGAVWVALAHTDSTTGATTGSVGHLSGAFTASNLSAIPLPTASPSANSRPRSFALAADGNLYLTANSDKRMYKIPVSNPSTATIAAIPLPKYTPGPGASFPYASTAQANGIAAGTDGKLYIANHSALAPNVLQFDPSAGTFAALTLPGPAQDQMPRYMAAGSDGNIYESSNGSCFTMPCGGALNALTTSGVFTQIALPDGASQPDDLAAGKGFIAFADLGEAALGTYTFGTNEVRDYPIEAFTAPCCSVWKAPNGVTVASDGSLWYVTYGTVSAGGPIAVAHVVMTSNWSVWPTQTISLTGAGAQSQQLIAVMESGDSGPFTLASSDSTVATLQAIAGESHDFHLVGAGAGSCTVTITDKNGRSEKIAVSVTTTSGTVQSTSRRTPDTLTPTQGGVL